MIITAQSPTRIGLFGGGTDLPVFYNSYGGIVLSMAINLRQHITLGGNTSLTERDNASFFEGALKEMDYLTPVTHTNDCIIEAGLGSSASCAVALVAAAARGKGIFMSRREIAEKAWDIEVNKLGLYGGKQDQYAAAYGGVNVFYFNKDTIAVSNIDHDKADFLKRNILLFHTGENRKNTKIQEELKTLSQDKLKALSRIKEIAHDAKKYLSYGDFTNFGRLFDVAWQEKKKSNPLVTTPRIDNIYDIAISCGAEGGRLCGSGGGGFMMFWVPPFKQQYVIDALEEVGCKYYDFSIDWTGVETRVISK